MSVKRNRKELVTNFLVWVSKRNRSNQEIQSRLLYLLDVVAADDSIDYLERLERNSIKTIDSNILKGYEEAIKDLNDMIFPK